MAPRRPRVPLTIDRRETEEDVAGTLSAQCQRQDALDRQRMLWWIPWLFVMGLGLAVTGLVTSVARFQEEGSPVGRVVFMALSVAFFGWAVVLWLRPLRREPRIVPYFARQLEEYGGTTSSAFARGRGLYREIAALDRLARTRGTRPLSDFGFADDYYDQEVRWHAASDGLRTVEALRQGSDVLPATDVALDLETLAKVLRVAADQGVPFSLALRLHKKDSIQVISSGQRRQGRFW